MTNSISLKIKRKNLADESRSIRQEEFKAKKAGNAETLNSLHNHRLLVVRPAARSAHLAHTFLRGKEYKTAETSCRPHNAPSIASITSNIRKFGDIGQRASEADAIKKQVEKWLKGEYVFPELELEAA